MNTKKYTNNECECPNCQHKDLYYGTLEIMDDGLCYYPWSCPKCHMRGEEWYRLEFQGHNVYDEEGNIIEL